jgi:hypothetical protein
MSVSFHKIGQLALSIAIALAGIATFAQDDTVSSPTKRDDTIAKAKKLLAPREIVSDLADPFHSEAFYGRTSAAPSSGATVSVGPRTGRDLLEAIAASLKPSGYFVISGEPTLVFGQKRVKAGGSLTINFEGSEYTLEIISINRTNFTLRLNREEFTRPIK